MNVDDPRRLPPAGYGWPGSGIEGYPQFWLEPQPCRDGKTPLFMIVGAWPDRQSVMAERCYARYGVQIVDALRLHAAAGQ